MQWSNFIHHPWQVSIFSIIFPGHFSIYLSSGSRDPRTLRVHNTNTSHMYYVSCMEPRFANIICRTSERPITQIMQHVIARALYSNNNRSGIDRRRRVNTYVIKVTMGHQTLCYIKKPWPRSSPLNYKRIYSSTNITPRS
jgi:hypothetical protein